MSLRSEPHLEVSAFAGFETADTAGTGFACFAGAPCTYCDLRGAAGGEGNCDGQRVEQPPQDAAKERACDGVHLRVTSVV